MKIFGVGLVAFTGLLTEQFVRAGILGCALYAALIAIGVTLFCTKVRTNKCQIQHYSARNCAKKPYSGENND